MALPRKNRLTIKKDIDRVFRNGGTVKGSFLFIRLLKNRNEYPRFAFIVSTKHVPLAVDRNKIRRMLSEEIANIHLPGHRYDIVVVICKKIERRQIKEVVEDLIKTIREIWS